MAPEEDKWNTSSHCTPGGRSCQETLLGEGQRRPMILGTSLCRTRLATGVRQFGPGSYQPTGLEGPSTRLDTASMRSHSPVRGLQGSVDRAVLAPRAGAGDVFCEATARVLKNGVQQVALKVEMG